MKLPPKSDATALVSCGDWYNKYGAHWTGRTSTGRRGQSTSLWRAISKANKAPVGRGHREGIHSTSVPSTGPGSLPRLAMDRSVIALVVGGDPAPALQVPDPTIHDPNHWS